MKIYSLIYLIIFLLNSHILAQELVQEHDIIKFHQGLRCIICEGQSVYDSETDFAKDIKSQTFTMLEQGKTLKEIEDFYIDSYGENILLTPKFNKANLLLWLTPYLLILIFAFFYFRKK